MKTTVGQLKPGSEFRNEFGTYRLEYLTAGGAYIRSMEMKTKVIHLDTKDIEINSRSNGFMVSLDTPATLIQKGEMEMKMQELVNEFNRITGKNTKRFATIAAGEKALEKARRVQTQSSENETIEALQQAHEELVPAAEQYFETTVAGANETGDNSSHKGDTEMRTKRTKKTKTVTTGKKGASRAGIKQTRVLVCKGDKSVGYFKSVREAFEKLKLPIGRHIRFRMELKQKGHLSFEDKFMFCAKGKSCRTHELPEAAQA